MTEGSGSFSPPKVSICERLIKLACFCLPQSPSKKVEPNSKVETHLGKPKGGQAYNKDLQVELKSPSIKGFEFSHPMASKIDYKNQSQPVLQSKGLEADSVRNKSSEMHFLVATGSALNQQ